MIPLERFEKTQDLACKIAGIIHRKTPYYDLDDLHQGALIGLWEAANRFNPSKGASFKTYAYRYMTGRAITHGRAGTRLGDYWTRFFWKRDGCLPKFLRRSQGYSRTRKYLKSALQRSTACFREVDDKDELEHLLKVLTPIERSIIEERAKGLQQKEIAAQRGVIKQTIQKAEKRAMEKLREAAKNQA